MTPSASGTAEKYCLKLKIDNFNYTFSTLLGSEPCPVSRPCLQRGACMKHPTLTRSIWNQQIERRGFNLVGWAKFQLDKELALVNQRKENQLMEANKICGDFCLRKEKRKSLVRAGMNTLVSLRIPRQKVKTQLDISWTVRWSELGRKQDNSPGKTVTPGYQEVTPTTQKVLPLEWTRAPVEWEGDRAAVDTSSFGISSWSCRGSPSLLLFLFWLQSGYSGLTMALRINESKVVTAGNFWQFSLWCLWVTHP